MFLINNYDPLTVPEQLDFEPVVVKGKHKKDFDGNLMYYVVINGQTVKCVQTYMDQSKWPPGKYAIPETRIGWIKESFSCLVKPYPFTVEEFSYDGFGGQKGEAIMPYRAKFLRWSGDPGVAVMACSDGVERFIPSFAIKEATLPLPPDDTPQESKLLFGYASHS